MTNLAGETIDARCVGCIYIYIYTYICMIDSRILSELHLTRLCRTEPVAPAIPCADLLGAESRRSVLRLCAWRPFIPSQ
jgi:hypothetical protein